MTAHVSMRMIGAPGVRGVGPALSGRVGAAGCGVGAGACMDHCGPYYRNAGIRALRWTCVRSFRTRCNSRCASGAGAIHPSLAEQLAASYPSDEKWTRPSDDVVCAVATRVGPRPRCRATIKIRNGPAGQLVDSRRWVRMGAATSRTSIHCHAARARDDRQAS